MVQQCPPRGEVDKEIDITFLGGFSAHDGAEDTHVASTMSRRDAQNLLTPARQDLSDAHRPHPAPLA